MKNLEALWLCLLALAVIGGLSGEGCTTQQAAALKADEAIVLSDLNTGFLMLSGAAKLAAAHPEAMAAATSLGLKLAAKSGVPAATSAKIQAAITTGNATALAAAADEGAAITAGLQ